MSAIGTSRLCANALPILTCSGFSTEGLPPCLPRARAAANPALVRSRIKLKQLGKALAGDPASGGGLEGALALMVRPDPDGNAQETGLREYHYGLMIKDLDVAIAEAAKFSVRLPMVELMKQQGRAQSGLEYPMGEPL